MLVRSLAETIYYLSAILTTTLDQPRRHTAGRRRAPELRRWVLRLAAENSSWVTGSSTANLRGLATGLRRARCVRRRDWLGGLIHEYTQVA